MSDDKQQMIGETAAQGLAVAPPDPASDAPDADPGVADAHPGQADIGNVPHAQHPEQHAGQDPSLRERLAEDPACEDAKLDVALDETMDASDPPANTQPGHGQPLPSSGFPG